MNKTLPLPRFSPYLLLLAMLAMLLSACAGQHHRSVGNVIDDQSIEIAALDRMMNAKALDSARIKSVAWNGTLLLIGEVDDAAQRETAGNIAARIRGVKRVVNELAIGEHAGFWRRTWDGALNARVKSGLVNLGVDGFNASQVNVTTVRGEVYLMGLVSRKAADAVVDKISRMRGVRRVVKVFEYTD